MIGLIILLSVCIALTMTDIVLVARDNKKKDKQISNLLEMVVEQNEKLGKLDVKVSKNGDDIQKMKRERTLFQNELSSMQNAIETMNSGFSIPSYKNT